MGKIPKEICEIYYGYFNQGIKGIKAKRLYEKNLAKKKMQAEDGSRFNPRMSAVYSLYKKWKEEKKKNAEINKVHASNHGFHACSRPDCAFISQEIKIEPVDENEDYCQSNILNEVSVKVEDTDEENINCFDFQEIVYNRNEINMKIENPNEEGNSCPDFSQIVIQQRTVEIEEIVQESVNCSNTGLSFSNSQDNQLNGMENTGSYISHIQKRVSNSNVSQKFSPKIESPKIVNFCSLNTRSENNAMPSTSVVTNSTSYYMSSTSVQTNNFVSIINPPPVPLITNVNTNVVGPVQRAVSINNSHLTLYNPSSNTYTVVQLCLPSSPIVSPSNLYSAHFPNGIQSLTRV